MLKKPLDYDTLWDEIETELDTDVALDGYQDVNKIYPSQYDEFRHRPIYDPRFFIFFPHRRHFF